MRNRIRCVSGRALISRGHSTLDCGGTLDSIDDTGKLDQRTIAHELDDMAMELSYGGIDQFPAASL